MGFFDSIGDAFKSVVGGASGIFGGAVQGITGLFGGGGGGSRVPAVVRGPPLQTFPAYSDGGWVPNPMQRPIPLAPAVNTFTQPDPNPKYGQNVDRPAISVNNQVVSQPSWQQYAPYVVVGGVVVYLLFKL